MIGQTIRQSLISTGNETFDKFLGGGLLNSSLNLIERRGPSSRIIEPIVNKSIAATTLTEQSGLIYVNFNTSHEVHADELLTSLPSQRKIRSDILYKDIKGKSAVAQIKIAWRYSNRGISSPTDSVDKINQIDFGVALVKTVEPDSLGKLSIVNVGHNDKIDKIIHAMQQSISEERKSNQAVNIILKDLMHPFSPFIGREVELLRFLYAMRCQARSLNRGAILACYDLDVFDSHQNLKQQLYNIVDCVISFHSYETDENFLTGYKDIDGSLCYVKVPKINSFGFHFQQEISDWGYRLTKNLRYFVVDELSLPPCGDADEDPKAKQTAPNLTKIDNIHKPLEQVGPLEEFREVASDVIMRKL